MGRKPVPMTPMPTITINESQSLTFTVELLDANGVSLGQVTENVSVEVAQSTPTTFTLASGEAEIKKEEIVTKTKKRIVRVND